MPHTVLAIPAFNDNYIWMIVHPATQQAIVVDPGDAAPVLQALKHQKWALSGILITHHHADHTGGVEKLCAEYAAPVFGPAEFDRSNRNPAVSGGDTIEIPELDLRFDVIDTPGHTLGHIAFTGHGWLFCGDTLFAGGCGRLFEGTPEQLHHSLNKLSKLDPATRVYCAHEYTASNLRFAESVEPNNPVLRERIYETAQQRDKDLPTLPSTIALEKQTNPFLRCHLPEVKAAIQNQTPETHLVDEVAFFGALRRWKDNFR